MPGMYTRCVYIYVSSLAAIQRNWRPHLKLIPFILNICTWLVGPAWQRRAYVCNESCQINLSRYLSFYCGTIATNFSDKRTSMKGLERSFSTKNCTTTARRTHQQWLFREYTKRTSGMMFNSIEASPLHYLLLIYSSSVIGNHQQQPSSINNNYASTTISAPRPGFISQRRRQRCLRWV